MTPHRYATTISPRHALLSTLALGFVSGCPDPDENPAVLWLALDGRETDVRLIDEEPEPY